MAVESNDGKLVVDVKAFHRGGLDPDDVGTLEDAGRGDLAMILVDTAYDGDGFRLADYHFGEDLRAAGWGFEVSHRGDATVMLVLVDVHGNELRRAVASGEAALAGAGAEAAS